VLEVVSIDARLTQDYLRARHNRRLDRVSQPNTTPRDERGRFMRGVSGNPGGRSADG
jgi:hypothetical protein